MKSRYLLSAALVLGLAGAPAAFAQDKPMNKDSMGKTEKMDKMDKMEKTDGMTKTDKTMKKTDGMSDPKDKMSDGMKK